MQCSVKCTIQYLQECRVWCQVQFTGGREGLILTEKVSSASHFEVWVQFIVQYGVQCSGQYNVHCKLQCSLKYRRVGCPGTHWVVTRQPVKTKLAQYSHVQPKTKFISIIPFEFWPGLARFCFWANIGGYFHSRVPKLGRRIHGYALKSPRGQTRLDSKITHSFIYPTFFISCAIYHLMVEKYQLCFNCYQKLYQLN